MTVYRIYYVAELEAQTQNEAETRVSMNPVLLQHLKTTIVPLPESFFPTEEELNVIPRDLLKIDPDLFDQMENKRAVELYKNESTDSRIFKVPALEAGRCFIIYFKPDIEDSEFIKCIETPAFETFSGVVGNFIQKDLGQNASRKNKSAGQ